MNGSSKSRAYEYDTRTNHQEGKERYGIKYFQCFRQSGSVEMEDIDDKLKAIKDKVDQFEMKNIFNMDETGLFSIILLFFILYFSDKIIYMF